MVGQEIARQEASTPDVEESVSEVAAVASTNFSPSLLVPPQRFSSLPANDHNETVARSVHEGLITSRHEPPHSPSRKNESAIQFSSAHSSSLPIEEAYSRSEPAFKISDQNFISPETFDEETRRLHSTSSRKAKPALLPEPVLEQTRAEQRHVPTMPAVHAEPKTNARASFSKQLLPVEETHLRAAVSPAFSERETSARPARKEPTQRRGQLRPMPAPERENVSFERAERFRKDAQTQAASGSAAMIRVNIGRIEVRAITPPAAPARPPQRARSGPLLSLEDYLRQRNGR